MAIIGGVQTPTGYEFQRDDGSTLVTGNTPASADFFAGLTRRQEQSAPLAMGGPQGGTGSPGAAPVATDARADMSGGGAGASGGGYSTKNQQTVVQGASAGAPTPVAQEVSYAQRAAAPPQPAAVDKGELVANPNAGGAGGGPGSLAPLNDHDDAAELARRERDWYLTHPNGGGSGPKPGTYQTGLKTDATREGIDPTRVAGMADAARTQGLADIATNQANAAYEAEVAGKMQAYENAEQGKDDAIREMYDERLRDLSERRERMEREVAETKIDPQQFWGDKTTGDKIAFVLAAAITGAFNGKAGIQGNQVLSAVNKRIDENINAQIRNLETKKGSVGELGRLYQQLREQGIEANAARAQLHARAIMEAQKMVRAQTSDTKSEAVRAGGESVLAGLASKVESIYFNAADKIKEGVDKTFKVVTAGANGTGGSTNPYTKARQAQQEAAKEQDGSQKYNAGPDKKNQPQRMVWNGTTYDMPNTGTEEGNRVRKVGSLGQVALASLGRVEQNYTNNLRDRFGPTASSTQENEVGRLESALSVMSEQGMIKESDVKRIKDGLLSPISGKDTIQSTKAFINDVIKSNLEQGGAVPVKKLPHGRSRPAAPAAANADDVRRRRARRRGTRRRRGRALPRWLAHVPQGADRPPDGPEDRSDRAHGRRRRWAPPRLDRGLHRRRAHRSGLRRSAGRQVLRHRGRSRRRNGCRRRARALARAL